MYRRTLTINWDGLGEDDDDDHFFESSDRLSSVVPQDLASSGSDDEVEFEDSRRSFSASASKNFRGLDMETKVINNPPSIVMEDYGMWMAEPGDVKERRKRLLQGMGLTSNKELLKLTSAKVVRAISRKVDTCKDSKPKEELKQEEPEPDPSNSPPILQLRSRSDGDIQFFSVTTKKRKEQLIGDVSKQRLTRTFSGVLAPTTRICQYVNSAPKKGITSKSSPPQNGSENMPSSILPNGCADLGFASFFLIKNLDTGKEFIVKESNEEGMWNKLSDLQTGKQLSMEEFEKSVGYSPVVKELMRRASVSTNDERKLNVNAYLSKSFRYSKKTGVALLKNIKGVANSMSGLITDKELEQPAQVEQKQNKNSSQWIKVRQQGKIYKDFTALQLCQEIQAHEGSIWTIRFSADARYLATAGEDRVIHVWEVQECDVMSTKPSDDPNSISDTPVNPTAGSNSDRPPLPVITHMQSERRKKGKTSNKKKGNSLPDYVNVPETVFALSEKPVCSLNGHQDDVLDLSWSKSQLLLSSSMDKTVRLWDVETQSCLKMFAHNDYVTCIHFNPVDDDHFISGSLDGKVRVWNVSDRKVVDWTDLHEMVTSTCYTPDGQGALIGSHKGSCRMYSTSECKLEQKENIELEPKKKSLAKKVTGFQFAPGSSTEVLVTSADSRIRIFDGSDMTYKFRGFRNTSSQISASFSQDGKYIISASEDSQVYIWKREEPKTASGKSRSLINVQTYEYFQCKDVSVAIPWPGSIKNQPPLVDQTQSKRHSKRSPTPPHPTNGSPTREDNSAGANSKRHLPPLPARKNSAMEKIQSSQDEDMAQDSPTDPGVGPSESFSSSSPSIRDGDSPSISSSSRFDGSNNQGNVAVQATAWGMVIVTATSGGEIRVYQNFGMPLKASRPTNLF
uniref:WD repeat-containing protein 44-like n=1 Tax=Nicotiana tabacum TaxID=4097 RepID=A0A1S4DA41_TOBAC|nr:PREDICTED: WD repeat-containing protein 44-like [Nicotiana tabacum]